MTTIIREKRFESITVRRTNDTANLTVLPHRVAERPPAFVHLGYFFTNTCRQQQPLKVRGPHT